MSRPAASLAELPDRLRDVDLYHMMHGTGLDAWPDEMGLHVWSHSLDAHERLHYFCFYMHRRFAVRSSELLEFTSTWWFMSERERQAYNQLCNDREKLIENMKGAELHEL